ncbi:MAG TPA: Ig-like domain-containing protein [Gemmatimonadaceae bacterium]|nr:Ig-like domain-containing protein [Gemmatimonadaceae bacterium]
MPLALVRLIPRAMLYSLVASSVTALAGCGGDSSGPGSTPASISQASTAQLTGTAGSVLSSSPTFVVKDANGNILAGVPVTVAVTSGTATLTNAPTTSGSGPTSVGTVTLGQQAGPSVITVTVNGLTPLTITVTGAAGPPASISIDQTFVASAAAGTNLVPPIAVRDQYGNPVANVVVTLTVAAGGGSINTTTATSGTDGHLPGVIWTLGKSAIPQALTATAGTLTGTLNAAVATNYPVDLRFYGTAPSPTAQTAFNDAVARIRGSVIGELSVITFPATTNVKTSCGGPDESDIGSSAGIIIYATVDVIDGPGKVLAQSFPCFTRTSNAIPVLGIMKFDGSDIDGLATSGTLSAVVMHEMLHALGVGTIWTQKGQLSGKDTPDSRFTGAAATAACTEAGGTAACTGGVKVENCQVAPFVAPNCGAGTVNSHWQESVFVRELMTGFAEHTLPMPYSKITIQSLADNGYSVNIFAADPYTVPAPGLSAAFQVQSDGVSQSPVDWELLGKPRFSIGTDRVIRRLPQ